MNVALVLSVTRDSMAHRCAFRIAADSRVHQGSSPLHVKDLSLNSSSQIRARHKSSASNFVAMVSRPFQNLHGPSNQLAYRVGIV
jgi:hypothetical protein